MTLTHRFHLRHLRFRSCGHQHGPIFILFVLGFIGAASLSLDHLPLSGRHQRLPLPKSCNLLSSSQGRCQVGAMPECLLPSTPSEAPDLRTAHRTPHDGRASHATLQLDG